MSNRKSRPQKRRRRSIIAFEMIRLDRTATEPLHQQLYRQIRDELRSGTFIDDASRLPSSRALAVDLGISRLTVNLALSKLHAEGYLRSKARSGTFVAHPLPETFLTADKFATGGIRHGGFKSYRPVEHSARISDRVRAIPDQRVGKQFDLGALGAGAGVSLVPGLPAVDEFPIDVWERLRSQVLAQKGGPQSGLAITYAKMGRQSDARRILDELKEISATKYVTVDKVASIYVALGEKDEAFRWLERAFEQYAAVAYFAPEFRPLRSDPAKALARQSKK
jgi:DNA-binding transcriptional regulator YhcF (GntR family)